MLLKCIGSRAGVKAAKVAKKAAAKAAKDAQAAAAAEPEAEHTAKPGRSKKKADNPPEEAGKRARKAPARG